MRDLRHSALLMGSGGRRKMAYIVALSAGWVTYSWFRAGQDHFSHGSRTLAIVWTIVFTILVVGAAIRTQHDRERGERAEDDHRPRLAEERGQDRERRRCEDRRE